MDTELQFVTYKQFVESLPARTSAASGDKTVVNNSTDGPGSETNAAQVQKILGGKIVPMFDPTRTSSNPYPVGYCVIYQGTIYKFKNPHYGPWNSSDVDSFGSLVNRAFVLSGTINVKNANDAEVGTYFWVSPDNSYSNFPVNDSGNFIAGGLITLGRYRDSTSQYVSQLYVTNSAGLYVRFKQYGGTWTGWKSFANVDLNKEILSNIAPDFDPTRTSSNSYPVGYSVTYQNKVYEFKNPHYGPWNSSDVDAESPLANIAIKLKGAASTSGLTDADNAVPGTIYWCEPNNSYSHFPKKEDGSQIYGNLFTIGRYRSNTTYMSQIYLGIDSVHPTMHYRFKRYGGAWTDWVSVADEKDVRLPVSLSMFPRVGVVGDSYASGYLCTAEGVAVGNIYPLSWPQILCRKTGCTWINFTHGGLSTRTWLTSVDYGLPALLAEDPCDLYVLVLGINDMAISGYLGSISDITSHESYADYPDTFYGNYGKIIEQILNHAPDSKIIFSTMFNNNAGSETSGAYNDAIESIASHYGVPVVRQYENRYLQSSIYKTMYGSHPTKAGQACMAVAFENMICECVAANLTYFNSISQ